MANKHIARLLLSLFLLASSSLALSYQLEDVLGQEGPEEHLQQCQRRCETQHHQDPGQLRQCQRRCQERYEEERREEQERGRGNWDDNLGQGGPEELLQQCQQRCETQHRQDAGQLRQCQRRCQERYEEERREQQERGRGILDEVLGQGSPQERLQQCQRRCETQHRQDPGQLRQCQRRCQERYEEERREEQERGRGNWDDNLGQGGPEERLQQCQRRCETQHRQDAGQLSQCQRQCQERYEEERREEQERGRGILDEVLGQGSPQERLQQCQRRCETQHRQDPGQIRQCQRRCQEKYEEERREEQERGRGNYWDDILGQGSPKERLQQCQRQCETQHSHDPGQLRQCHRRCQERFEEERREEQERGRGNDDVLGQESPEERLLQCQRQCVSQHRQDPSQLSQCQRRCLERYQQERRDGGSQDREGNPQREKEQQEGRSPYFFDQQSFQHRIRTQHGNVRVLERFTSRSELLRGIDNYRLGFIEVNPNAFVLPHHLDADIVFCVLRGRATIKLVRGEKNRQSYDIRRGDIMRIRAGTILYMANTDSNEKLYIANLMRPVSTPGLVKEYFSVGGEDPESFFRSFSSELLQAAFNAPRERVERMFGQQTRGAIIQASQEQIKAMSRGSSEGGHWPFGEGSRPFNLFKKQPTHSSRHGQLYEVNSDDCPELQDLDIQISFANISGGSMIAPYYLTRSTKLSLVVDGDGYFEMACPHISGESGGGREREQEERQEQEQRVRYQRVRSRLSRGTAFVAPPGHPIAIVASRGQNLQVLCFEINARNNQRFYLAGGNSILKQLEREAKELSFNMPAREAEEFLNRQDQSEFMPGPEQRQEKSFTLGSIMEFVGF